MIHSGYMTRVTSQKVTFLPSTTLALSSTTSNDRIKELFTGFIINEKIAKTQVSMVYWMCVCQVGREIRNIIRSLRQVEITFLRQEKFTRQAKDKFPQSSMVCWKQPGSEADPWHGPSPVGWGP